MKKFLALFSAFALAIAVTAGCNNEPEDVDTPLENELEAAGDEMDAAMDEAAAETDAAAAEAEAEMAEETNELE